MNRKQIILDFWQDVANQNASKLKNYFLPNATIYWHNANEQFLTEEYIRANCEYPGDWCGEVERIELVGNLGITVTRVWLSDNSASFHATSFFEFENDKIISLNEYWGDDGVAPQWRLDKEIGKPIK
ncbi:MAG: nuclear transport factor 2 family protein [Tissierella sp.]|nr:nuclear transport factor 2 family protein [Tissierella sp.]